MVKQLKLRIVLIYLHATTSGMTDIDYHYWVVLVKVALFCWSNSENVVWLVCIFDTLKQLIFNNKKLKQLLVHSASRIKSGKKKRKKLNVIYEDKYCYLLEMTYEYEGGPNSMATIFSSTKAIFIILCLFKGTSIVWFIQLFANFVFCFHAKKY